MITGSVSSVSRMPLITSSPLQLGQQDVEHDQREVAAAGSARPSSPSWAQVTA